MSLYFEHIKIVICFLSKTIDHTEVVALQVELLLHEMERLGTRGADGKLRCKFGVLIRDDRCSNVFEVIK